MMIGPYHIVYIPEPPQALQEVDPVPGFAQEPLQVPQTSVHPY